MLTNISFHGLPHRAWKILKILENPKFSKFSGWKFWITFWKFWFQNSKIFKTWKIQNFVGVFFKIFKIFWVISACLCYCAAAAAGSWWSFLFAFTAGCCCLPSLLAPGYWQFIVRSWLLAVSYCWLFLDTVGSNICFLLLINSDAAMLLLLLQCCCCCCDAGAVAGSCYCCDAAAVLLL